MAERRKRRYSTPAKKIAVPQVMAFPWLKDEEIEEMLKSRYFKAVPQVMAFPWLKGPGHGENRLHLGRAVPQVMAFPWLKADDGEQAVLGHGGAVPQVMAFPWLKEGRSDKAVQVTGWRYRRSWLFHG